MFAALFFVQQIQSQSLDSASLRRLFQTVDALQKMQQMSRTQRQADSLVIVSLKDSLTKKSSQVNEISTKLKKVEVGASELRSKLDLTSKGRYELIKNNLINATDLFQEINKRLNSLEALSQAQNYQNMVTQLNNPTDASMGFSYEEKVLTLLDQNIKIPKKKKGKLLSVMSAIIKSPIVQGIASLTPILSISNNILSTVSAIGFNEDDVNPDQISNFKNSLGVYTVYYTKLNDANNNSLVATKTYYMAADNLHISVKNLVTLTMADAGLAPPAEPEGSSAGEILNEIFKKYNKRNIEKYLTDLEASTGSKVNYDQIMKSSKLEIINSRIADVVALYKDFNQLYLQYLIILDQSNRETISVLDYALAQKLSSDDSKVREKIKTLKNSHKESVKSIKVSINIDELEEIAKQLVR
ncbi:MAG: hypothetical protein EAZ97_05565 [Bacteroidetes bacterium]|nr:MAG: hypothetical protein EAZ97_05565 [Bacteroidota bacterium]